MAMNKNRIIELCLVFLISILSFSIGTFIGKKYSDNQHKLALLDPNYKHDLNTDAPTTEVVHSEDSTAPAPVAAGGEGAAAHGENAALKSTITEGAPMSDADVAKMNAEMNNEEEESTDPNTVKTINEDGSTSGAAGAGAKTNAVKKTTPKTATATNTTKGNDNIVREVANISAKAKSITQDEKGLDGKTQYTVQIGSFPTPAEADKVVTSLQARGYKATQSEATVSGKTWYRVQVGLFGSLQDAQTYKKELVEQNHLTSAMILRVNK